MSIEDKLKATQSNYNTLKEEFLYASTKRADIYLNPVLLSYNSAESESVGLAKARDYLLFDD